MSRVLRPVAVCVIGVLIAAMVGLFVHQSVSIAAPTFSERLTSGVVTAADGVLPDEATAFDAQYPGIANLDSDLLQALEVASTAAGRDGLEIYVNSGWRSRAYQNELLNEAVAQYGSVKEAARWVATADTSPHVKGQAVDIGRGDADAWLSAHGARYGLCQIYRNEPWHFELRPQAATSGCPRMYADPTQDPRMQG